MFFRILKKDIKRKKTMNIILLIFIMLATMFMAASVNNVITVVNGIDYYYDKANIGDFVILTMGEDAIGCLDDFLTDNEKINDYRLEDTIFVTDNNVSINGEKCKVKNVGLVQNLGATKINFFDMNNRVVDSVEEGYVYVTADFIKLNDIKAGDKITINQGDVNVELEVKGKLKDALLGSSMMGNSRFLMNEKDYNKFFENSDIPKYYGGQVCYIESSDCEGLKEELAEAPKIAFDEPREKLQVMYIMDMIVAGIMIVLSICLIAISFVVLKFSITFTLTDEFREIGVMKAIGLKNKNIRNLYMIKYFFISLSAALVGMIASMPFSKLLIKSISENILIGNDSTLLINVVSSLFVVAVVMLFSYSCTKKVNKYTPIDAIRSGQTGERYKKKNGVRLSKSKGDNSSYLAVNDVLSSPKRYITIMITFLFFTLLLLLVVNTTETLQSDKLVTTFGKKSDAYILDVNATMNVMRDEGHAAAFDQFEIFEKVLDDNNMPGRISVEAQFKYKVIFDGKSTKETCQQGINTKASDYEYYKGSAPTNANEIAVTENIVDRIGAKIGDTITIYIGDQADEYLITGYFESMNQFGEIIRLHEDAPTDLRDCSSTLAFQVDFDDKPSDTVIDERIDELRDLFNNDEIYNKVEYTCANVSVVDTMKGIELMLIIITGIVVVLVTILMEKSFVSEETKEIAILKAVGFDNKTIIKWHLKRFLIVGIVAVLIAVAISIPVTKVGITPIFRIMGMRHVDFEFNYIKMFVLIPVLFLFINSVSASLTALTTNKIKSSDTASME